MGKLSALRLVVNTAKQLECTVANGQRCLSVGAVEVPFQVLNRVCMIEFVVLPDLPNELILGLDFWRSLGI